MPKLGLEIHVVDQEVYRNSVGRFREAGIVLPTFAELADPQKIPVAVQRALAGIDPDAAHPLNLFRVHWYNDDTRARMLAVPRHVVLPTALTGVEAPIVVMLGDRFPMIRAHKVLAAYGCLAPRIITGQFDPTRHRAIWPSTGNYCRGGVAISRILQCHGVAVLPEGMSQERFDWLERWVVADEDIVRTPGSESNVKEIYDKCAELDRDPQNIIFNQFSEFGNYLAHYLCTGTAAAHVFEQLADQHEGLRLRAFVSASGSAGTLATGDALKERFGSLTVVAEALECPTILYNGFGEHNIQGIGDKHIPYIHNVMGTDIAVAVSEKATDGLNLVFNTPEGRRYLLERRGLSEELVEDLHYFGLSSICNVLGAIKTAKYYGLGAKDAIFTVATDGAAMYESEMNTLLEQQFGGEFDAYDAAEIFGTHMMGAGVDHLCEMSQVDRKRVFNLGYYTWVEQQGIEIEEFTARQAPEFWTGLRALIPAWDEMIREFNAQAQRS